MNPFRTLGYIFAKPKDHVSTDRKHMLYALYHVVIVRSICGSNKSRIITTNNCYGQQFCFQAWHINVSSCALNRNDGSYLPPEYLHFVGR